MRYIRLLLIYVIVPALFYPVYFAVVNAADSLFGTRTLINWLAFESQSQLINTFLKDWLAALPVMFGIFYLIVLPVSYVICIKYTRHSAYSLVGCLVITVLLSYLLGFRGLEIVANGVAVLAFAGMYLMFANSPARPSEHRPAPGPSC